MIEAAKTQSLLVDANVLGALCDGLTGRRVRQLATEGVFPKARAGSYDAVVCVPAYWRWKHRSERKSEQDLDPAQARARKDQALAIATEIKNDLALGKVVLVDEVVHQVTALFLVVKNHLSALPSKLAARVPAAVRDAVNEVATEEIHAALEELSTGIVLDGVLGRAQDEGDLSEAEAT